MCKPGGGPNRCFIHNPGTKASIDIAKYQTAGKVPGEFVEQTAKDLRKEGRNLPTPSKEEVDQFLDQEKFVARNSPKVPDNKRKVLENRLEKARETQPDGGTLHSWRNTMKSSISRWKRSVAATGLAASIGLTAAACAPAQDNTLENTSSGVTQSQVATPSAGASSSAAPSTKATVTPTKEAPKVVDAPGFSAGKTIKDANGDSYTQLKVEKGNSLLEDNYSGSLPTGWKKSDEAKSRQYAANFLMTKLVDSPYAGTGKTTKHLDGFKKDIKNDLDPTYSSSIYSNITPQATMVPLTNYYNENPGGPKGYKYSNDGMNRIVNMQSEITNTENIENLGVKYSYSMEYDVRAVDSAGNKYLEPHKDTYFITVTKSDSGKMQIAGLGTNFMWKPPVKQ